MYIFLFFLKSKFLNSKVPKFAKNNLKRNDDKLMKLELPGIVHIITLCPVLARSIVFEGAGADSSKSLNNAPMRKILKNFFTK